MPWHKHIGLEVGLVFDELYAQAKADEWQCAYVAYQNKLARNRAAWAKLPLEKRKRIAKEHYARHRESIKARVAQWYKETMENPVTAVALRAKRARWARDWRRRMKEQDPERYCAWLAARNARRRARYAEGKRA